MNGLKNEYPKIKFKFTQFLFPLPAHGISYAFILGIKGVDRGLPGGS